METINNLTFELTENNIRILQSFNIHKIEMYKFIKVFKNKYPKHNVSQISTFLLICEWSTHNLLYKLNIYRNRTKDVDLNTDNKWYIKLAYILLSIFYW